MSNLYKTRVNAYGGRSGTIRSEDGILDMPLALPKELGGNGGATNPEQLFAAGYAACFEDGFKLVVALDVEIAGVEQSKAEEIVKAAHAVCPYSNAIRGNVDVTLTVFAQ